MKKSLVVVTVLPVAVAAVMLPFLGGWLKKKSAPEKKMVLTLPVHVAAAEKRSFSMERSYLGIVYPESDVMVLSETAGRVLSVPADLGQKVESGAIIAVVDGELARAGLQAAAANLEKARNDLERAGKLFDQGALTAPEMEGAALALKLAKAQHVLARKQVENTKIRSPIAGVMAARFITKGSTLAPGAPVANIVDIASLRVLVAAAEEDVFGIRVGDGVELASDVYKGVTFAGVVKSVGDKGDEAHTYPVEIALANSLDNPLKAGMFMRAVFSKPSGAEVLAIPRGALAGSPRDARVFVVKDGAAWIRAIVTGHGEDSMVEVKEGLEEGDLVVVSGVSGLKDGARVSIVGNGQGETRPPEGSSP